MKFYKIQDTYPNAAVFLTLPVLLLIMNTSFPREIQSVCFWKMLIIVSTVVLKI